jgi:hypothetical protein
MRQKDWNRLLGELYNMYSSPNMMYMIISRRMRWVKHVAYMGTGKMHAEFGWGNLRERERYEHLGIDRIILK